MRFPLALTVKIARHILRHKWRRTPRFALVLQLEPLHTCNLTCTGCGRIREYSTSLKDMMSLEDCLASARECDAPMVSVCMVHCGYDPSGALGTDYRAGDNWKNFKYNFQPRPAPCPEGRQVNIFNGHSIGQGHSSGAKAGASPSRKPAP